MKLNLLLCAIYCGGIAFGVWALTCVGMDPTSLSVAELGVEPPVLLWNLFCLCSWALLFIWGATHVYNFVCKKVKSLWLNVIGACLIMLLVLNAGVRCGLYAASIGYFGGSVCVPNIVGYLFLQAMAGIFLSEFSKSVKSVNRITNKA